MSLFRHQQLNQAGVEALTTITSEFEILLGYLTRFCSDGREFSIAKTHLEEACMYAKKAMSQDKRFQK